MPSPTGICGPLLTRAPGRTNAPKVVIGIRGCGFKQGRRGEFRRTGQCLRLRTLYQSHRRPALSTAEATDKTPITHPPPSQVPDT